MNSLIAAAVLFIGIHLLVSGTALRGALVSRLGEMPYRGLFSLLSFGALAWLCISFPRAEGEAVPLWNLGVTGQWIAILLVLIAAIFVVTGLTTPNPTSVGQERILQAADSVRGILHITRHPFLIGVSLWAIAHILTNGNLAALIFFGAFLIVAAFGPSSIDAKRRSAAHWGRFAGATSIVPFGAIMAGRNRLVLSELLTWRMAAAVAAFVIFAVLHPLIFSVPALPL